MSNIELVKRYLRACFVSLGLAFLSGLQGCFIIGFPSTLNVTKGSFHVNLTSDCPGSHSFEIESHGNVAVSRDLYLLLIDAHTIASFVLVLPTVFLIPRIGCNVTLAAGIVIPASLYLLIYIPVKFGSWIGILFLLIFAGLADGAAQTAAIALIGRWSIKNDVSFFTAVTLTGYLSGPLIARFIIYLCQSWITGIYILASVCIGLWLPLWICFFRKDEGGPSKVPWKIIVKDKAVISWAGAGGVADVALKSSTNYLPFYLSHFIGDWTRSVEVWGPALVILTRLGAALGMDFIIFRNILPRTATRKLFTGIGMFGIAFCLYEIGDALCVEDTVFALLCLVSMFAAIFHPGLWSIPVDLSPPYCSVVYSLSSLPALIIHTSISFLTNATVESGSREEYLVVFYVVAGLCTVGAFGFVLLGSAEERSWECEETVEEQPHSETHYERSDSLVSSNVISVTSPVLSRSPSGEHPINFHYDAPSTGTSWFKN